MTDPNRPTGPSGANPPTPPPSYQPPAPPPSYQAPPPSGQQGPPPGYQAPPPGYQSPPPGYQTPPSYAPGGPGSRPAGFDPKSLQNFDPKSVNPLDWGIIAAGLLAFIFSTFSYYKYSIGGYSGTVSAWHGFFGWFATLVALAAAVVLAVNLIAKISLPFPIRLVVLGGFALALLCTLLAFLVVPGDTGGAVGDFKISKGHGFGYWLSLLAIIGGTGLSYVRFTQTGGKLPGRS